MSRRTVTRGWIPTAGERIAMRLARRLTVRALGHASSAVVEESVRLLGASGWVRHHLAMVTNLMRLRVRHGNAEAQFIIGVVSLFLGCGYCAYGHSRAGSLLWFRDRGSLHPLDPAVMATLMEMKDDQLIARIDTLLAAPEHRRLRRITRRIYELFVDENPTPTPDDERLRACLSIWRCTTEYTIVEGISARPDHARALHPIGRDHELRARHDDARRMQRPG